MKKILLTVFSIILCLYVSDKAYGFVRYEGKDLRGKIELNMSGFTNYAPFGWSEGGGTDIRRSYNTIFQPLIDLFEKDANVEIKLKVYNNDIDELVQKVREGSVDFFVGAYSETELFRGLHLLYPAVIYNLITVFMMPNRISEVKSTEDLKKLKGVRNVNEIFSDFVNKRVAEYNIIEVETPYQAFEKLFNREADYIISSYYNGMIEATKLGIENQVAPAKQSLWRIPLFVGVAKTSRNKDMISKRITKYLTDKNNLKAVEDNLKDIITYFQNKYKGVVAPSFVKDTAPVEQTEQTPVSDNHQ